MIELKYAFPFILAMGQKAPALNVIRIVESLIIALVTAAVTMYGLQREISVEVINLKTRMDETRADVSNHQAAISSQIRSVSDQIRQIELEQARVAERLKYEVSKSRR